MAVWDWLFDPSGLTPHGFCLSWAPGLVALHAGSDAIIGLSYFSIPLALAWFVRKRRDVNYSWVLNLFAGFILACGATHFFSLLTLWVPAYGIEGLLKALTAVLSVATAAILWPLIPHLIALPSPSQLQALNRELSERIAAEERASALLKESEARVRAINTELEGRVLERTRELRVANEELTAALQSGQDLIESLTKSNLERTHFVVAASHDLREPLRMVTAFCGRLSSEYDDKFDMRGKEYMSLVIKATRHMTQLLDDVVEFGRLDSSNGREDWFETHELLDRVQANLAEAIGGSGAEISRGELPKIYGNPIRFQRALENLVGNALKYVAPDVSPRIRVSATQTGDGWRFSVSDNGIGIEARHFERIFEPFRRLHDKRRYSGTGLGLAICRKIVEGFGGEIAVSSTVGEGSIFSFTVSCP